MASEASENETIQHDDGPFLPGHREVSYDLGTPRQFTARGGWNIRCECGAAFAETGDEDFEDRWLQHRISVTPAGETTQCDESCHEENRDECTSCDSLIWDRMCDSCRSYAEGESQA